MSIGPRAERANRGRASTDRARVQMLTILEAGLPPVGAARAIHREFPGVGVQRRHGIPSRRSRIAALDAINPQQEGSVGCPSHH
jgi:hypothetical protein